jgi:hypothetical protein
MIDQGKAKDLNAILTDPVFNQYKNVQLAKISSANASILESVAGVR